MLKAYKTALFNYIRDAGYDTRQFRFSESDNVAIVHVENTNFVFEVAESPVNGNFSFRYSLLFRGTTNWNHCGGKPREDISQPPGYEDFNCTFERVLESFKRWLEGDAMRAIQAEKGPDPWSQAETFDSVFGHPRFSQEDTRPFTPEEKTAIRESTVHYRLLIVEHFGPTEEQLNEINERLDYLADAVERLNRFDWKSVALSTVIAIGINLTVDTTGGQALMKMFEQAFGIVVKLLTKGGI